ncbi:MAG: YdiU family protein [Candidatus Omnitrophica bacterium]|nr:YdiU family protein [Candidatus Omnitrophota bacterium]
MKYPNFNKLDGTHPWREVSPEGFVDYPVRYRKGGKILFFNFPLARDLGLISKNHPTRMNPKLYQKILETFSLQILNEYDWINRKRYPRDKYVNHLFMATRYLQQQHKSRSGKTSGDGRSIWNGTITNENGMTFDVSSRGTGNTILSPGAQLTSKPIPIGDNSLGYSSGLADDDEMLGGALMSEIFYQRGIPTERTLAVIVYSDKTSIGVRTAPNLLRPAHLFRYLKSGQYKELKASYDYYLNRQESNKVFKLPKTQNARYRTALKYLIRNHAKFAALLEEEYIFNWLAWDGDNLLIDGAVLDYGSVRQFAAKHSKYRYLDVNRYSASLTEQKRESRYIIQTFLQMIDFLITKKKKTISHFANDQQLVVFDQFYQQESHKCMLWNMGFEPAHINRILKHHKNELAIFRRELSYFEDVKDPKGQEKVPDGIDHPPIFLVRNILRVLPQYLYEHRKEKAWPILPADEFCRIMAKSYVDAADLNLTPLRKKRAFEFQRRYMDLIYAVGKNRRWETLKTIAQRSAVINYKYRGTGDGLTWITTEAIKAHNRLDQNALQEVLDRYIKSQVLVPGKFEPIKDSELKGRSHKAKLIRKMWEVLKEFNESI